MHDAESCRHPSSINAAPLLAAAQAATRTADFKQAKTAGPTGPILGFCCTLTINAAALCINLDDEVCCPRLTLTPDCALDAESSLILVFLWQEHAITSDEILVLDELPERAVIVGAGYIALEFAGILNGMGVDTHVMFRGDKPLRGYGSILQSRYSPYMQTCGTARRILAWPFFGGTCMYAHTQQTALRHLQLQHLRYLLRSWCAQ